MTESHVDVQNRELLINGEVVPCRDSAGRRFCCRVSVTNTVTIPPRNESIVFGRMKNPEGAGGLGIVESGKQGKLIESGAMVARTVVDMSEVQSDMVPMRIFNPTLETITVKEGDCIGKVTPAVSCEKVGIQDSCNDQNDVEIVIDVISRVPAHLQDLYWASVTELPLEQHRRVAKFLIEYQDVFSAGDYDLGRTGLTRHRIDTRFATPNRERPRRMAPSQQAEVDRQIKGMLARGVIEPSSSPWSSPIVLVTTRPDSSSRRTIAAT